MDSDEPQVPTGGGRTGPPEGLNGDVSNRLPSQAASPEAPEERAAEPSPGEPAGGERPAEGASTVVSTTFDAQALYHAQEIHIHQAPPAPAPAPTPPAAGNEPSDAYAPATATTDPIWLTTELAPLRERHFSALAEYRQPWQERLLKDRFVLLISRDEDVLMEAAHSLCERLRGAPGRRRLSLRDHIAKVEKSAELTKDEGTAEPSQEEKRAGLVLQNLLDRRAELTRNAVVIEAQEPESASRFLDSLQSSTFQADTLQASLVGVTGYLIFLVTDTQLGARVNRWGRLPIFSVPALEIRLRCAFPDRFDEIRHRILAQQAAGTGSWPQDEAELCLLVQARINAGTLEADLASAAGRPPVPPPQLGLLPELERSALFLATFLPSLPVRDFEEILLTLVAGREERLARTEVVRDADGGAELREESTARPLAERWREDPQAVLGACQLEQRPGQGSAGTWATPVVDLREAGHRQAVRLQFLGSHYLAFGTLLKRLLAEHPLLDPRPAVYGPVVMLLAEITRADPGLFSLGQLTEMFQAVEHYRQAPQAAGSFAEAVARWVSAEAASQHLLGRAYLLLRTLQDQEEKSPRVGPFLNELLGAGLATSVLALGRRLRDAPGFDELYWCQQVLFRGGVEARGAAVRQLQYRAQQGPAELRIVLERLASWFPADAEDPPRRSSVWVLHTLLGLLEAAFLPAPVRHREARLLTAKILEGLEAEEARRALLPIIGRALFHPLGCSWLEQRAVEHGGRLVALWLDDPRPEKGDDAPLRALAAPLMQALAPHLVGVEQRLAAHGEALPALLPAIVLSELVFGLAERLPGCDRRELLAALLPAAEAGSRSVRRALPIVWGALREVLLAASSLVGEQQAFPSELRSLLRQRYQEQRQRLGELRELHASLPLLTNA